MSMRHRSLAVVVMVVAPWLVSTAHAQDTTGRRGGRARLAGRVVDSRTGDPLPGATVTIVGTSIGGTASEQGRFTIANAPTGVFAVEARRRHRRHDQSRQEPGTELGALLRAPRARRRPIREEPRQESASQLPAELPRTVARREQPSGRAGAARDNAVQH